MFENIVWLDDVGMSDVEKVGGKINVADALTKYCATESIDMHVKGVGMIWMDGRHELAPEVDKGNLSGGLEECEQ